MTDKQAHESTLEREKTLRLFSSRLRLVHYGTFYGACERCGAPRNPKGGCPNEIQHVHDLFYGARVTSLVFDEEPVK